MINSAAQITTGWLYPQRIALSVHVHSLNFDKLCDIRLMDAAAFACMLTIRPLVASILNYHREERTGVAKD